MIYFVYDYDARVKDVVVEHAAKNHLKTMQKHQKQLKDDECSEVETVQLLQATPIDDDSSSSLLQE